MWTDLTRLSAFRRLAVRILPMFAFAAGGLVAAPALAAGGAENCALLGAFDPRARAACEALVRSQSSARSYDRRAPATPVPTVGGRSPGFHDQRGTADRLSPPAPPAAGHQRFEVVKGGLFVDIAGVYPDGYRPSWARAGNEAILLQGVQSAPLATRPGSDRPSRIWFNFGTENGRPVIAVKTPAMDGTCIAEIAGLPQVITSRPKRLQLSNLHYLSDGGQHCSRAASRHPTPWAGWIALSATPDGDLLIDLSLTKYNPQGQPWVQQDRRGQRIANQMTPAQAIAAVEQRRLRVLAAAKAKAEAEQRLAIRMARKLTPLESRIDTIIRQDASAWIFNTYDVKSVVNARSLTLTAETAARYDVPAGAQNLHAEFTTNDGRAAAVDIVTIKGVVHCVQFWDEGSCRPLGQPQSRDRLQAAASQTFTGGVVDGAGACSRDNPAGCSRQQIEDINSFDFHVWSTGNNR